VFIRPDQRVVSTLRKRSFRGLDLLNFFMANVQTGFGPFIAIYLTAHSWTQFQIGLVLSVGTISGMLSQVPAGALIDATPRKRLAAALSIGALALSALALGLWPALLPVLVAEVLHGFASATLVPAISAISLTLVSQREIGERFGRNVRWASIGNGLAAAAMGVIGYCVSYRAVFLLTAVLAVPSLISLSMIRQIGVPSAGLARAVGVRPPRNEWWDVFLDRRLIAFAGCSALFQLANAAMLQLMGGELTKQSGSAASLVIAACIVLPQLVVAALSPWAGRAAERWGRRPVLLLGFLALPIRALLFAATASPLLVVPVQALDGIAGATFGVLVPLIAADLTIGSGRFNLCMGVIGLAGGIGAAISSTVAGAVADSYGVPAAFVALAFAGTGAVLLAWGAMPETRPGSAISRKLSLPSAAALRR
jgi:MFS family permease